MANKGINILPVILMLGFLAAGSASAADAPAIEWQNLLGGTGGETGWSIRQTFDGGYIVAGTTSSVDGDVTGYHGGYSTDIWVVKLTAAGALEWQRALGGTGLDAANHVEQTADGGYIVAGSTNSTDGDVTDYYSTTGFPWEAWVVKLTPSGTIAWEKILRHTMLGGDEACCVKQTPDGGFIVAGTIMNRYYWVSKLGPDGTREWERTYGGQGYIIAQDIGQTSDGGYIVAGFANSNAGDVTGNHGFLDAWIVKVSPSGALEWQKSLGGTGADGAYSIAQASDGGYIMAGYTYSNDGDVSGHHGMTDGWVVKLSPAGSPEWQKSLGGTGVDRAYHVVQAPDGGFVVAGSSNSTDGDVSGNHGQNDVWVVKLESTGDLLWDESLGGSGQELSNSLECVSGGGYILTGPTGSDNSGDVGASHGGADVWVVKLGPDGSPFPVTSGITLLAPNGGESWQQGSTQTIRWQYNATAGPMVMIELFSGAVPDSIISGSTPVGNNGTGSFAWTVPAVQLAGTDYRIRVTSTSNLSLSDMSDNPFSIVKAQPLSDLTLFPTDITFSKPYPLQDSDIVIQATIRNTGANASQGFVTRFTDTRSASVIGTVSVPPLAAESTATVTIPWAPLCSSTELTVTVDPDNSIAETNETNNVVTVPSPAGMEQRLLDHLNGDMIDDSHNLYHFYEEFYDYDNDNIPPDPARDSVCDVEDDDIWIALLFPIGVWFMHGDDLTCGVDGNTWYSVEDPSGNPPIGFTVDLAPFVGDDLAGFLKYTQVATELNGMPVHGPVYYDWFENRPEVVAKTEMSAATPLLGKVYASNSADVFYDPKSDLIVWANESQIDAGVDLESFEFRETRSFDSWIFNLTADATLAGSMDFRAAFKPSSGDDLIPFDAAAPSVRVATDVSGTADLVVQDPGLFDSPPSVQATLTPREPPFMILEGVIAKRDFRPGESIRSPYEMDVNYRNLKAASPVLRFRTSEITVDATGTINYDFVLVPPDSVSFSYSTTLVPAYENVIGETAITAHSPVNITVFDLEGRYGGSAESSISKQVIPGSSYTEQDGGKEIKIPSLIDDFTVLVEGTGTGTYNLTISSPVLIEAAGERTVSFVDIAVTRVTTEPGDRDYLAVDMGTMKAAIEASIEDGDDLDDAVTTVVRALDFDDDGTPDYQDTNLEFTRKRPSVYPEPCTGQPGEIVNLTARLIFLDQPLTGKTVAFQVGGSSAGSVLTGESGIARFQYRIPGSGSEGKQEISATFSGDSSFLDATGSALLTIRDAPPSVRITSPAPFARVSGIVVIDGDVRDTNFASLSLTIDDEEVSATLPYSWNATISGYGVHVIELTARDALGNTGSDAIAVMNRQNVIPFPGCTNPPTDPDLDGIYEDINGNGRKDFADVVSFFIHMQWIAANEPVAAFDLNGNGRIDFADIVALFNEI